MAEFKASFRGASTNVKRLMLLGAIIVLVLMVLFINTIRHSQLFVNATTHQPETYTELYFSQPNQLPSVANAGQSIPVNFTIHNVEARNMQYTYAIQLSDAAGHTIKVLNQSVNLGNGMQDAISSKIALPNGRGKYEISVILKNQPEAIHYWTESV